MKLPVAATPIFTTTVPSTKKSFKFRPLLVKEEKALLIAQQTEDHAVLIETLKSVIKSCAKSDINVDELAVFDVEYIFLQIRAKSIGEIVEMVFRCSEDHGEDNKKAKVTIPIDLTKITVKIPDTHTKKIHLFDDSGVVMKYPSLDLVKELDEKNLSAIEQCFFIARKCIDFIYTADEMIKIEDVSDDELRDFIENLSTQQFDSIQNFFRTMPGLSMNINYACPVCSKKHVYHLSGIDDFF
jgi:hypothetical protein